MGSQHVAQRQTRAYRSSSATVYTINRPTSDEVEPSSSACKAILSTSAAQLLRGTCNLSARHLRPPSVRTVEVNTGHPLLLVESRLLSAQRAGTRNVPAQLMCAMLCYARSETNGRERISRRARLHTRAYGGEITTPARCTASGSHFVASQIFRSENQAIRQMSAAIADINL